MSVQQTIRAARQALNLPQTVEPDRYASVIDLYSEAIERYRGLPAFTSLGRTITYTELDELASAFAAYLQHHSSLRPGDRIAIQLPNLIQYPVVVFGALKAGLVVVNTNPLYKPEEVEHQFCDAGVKALVVLANVADAAAKVIAKTGVEHVIITELADLHSSLRRTAINFVAKYVKKMVPDFDLPNAISLREALDKGREKPLEPPTLRPEDLAMLQYTGGTTGVAKGAMLTHRNLVANAMQAGEMFVTYGFKPAEELVIMPLPLYHIYSFTMGLIMIVNGDHSVLIPNPRDMKGLVKELGRWRFTAFFGLNTLFVALCKQPDFAELDFSRFKLTLSGGMALTADAAKRWQQVTGCQICEGYGLTETSPIACVNPGTANKIGTIGVPVPGTEIKIIDERDVELDVGQPGELCIRGPQVMAGYWNRPVETQMVLNDQGWLKTGDVAVVQETGYLKIVDRKKDMILVSGFNVYPNELEDVLSQHPDVIECAAIGVPDEYAGEAIKMFVVPGRSDLEPKELLAYMRPHLTNYKMPKYIEFREELPKSNVGKVLRRELRGA